jgi:pre-rRNA-processing protein IPI3
MSRSPMHTLSTHRGPITSLICGHSSSGSNIAVSASEDKSAIIWDYRNGQALRTYLLPEIPRALALDPADRAVYVAYSDGSLQSLDFYDEVQVITPTDTLRDSSSSHRPIQPAKKTRFSADSQKLGAALSLSLSWDGTSLISGHESGKVAVWDAPKKIWISTLASLPGPVTNLLFLEPTGFPKAQVPTFKIDTIVKPKQDFGTAGSEGLVPLNYSLNMEFVGRLPSLHISATESSIGKMSEFEEALTHPSFPQAMLEEGLAELAIWNAPSKGGIVPAVDFLSLNESSTVEGTDLLSGDARSDEFQELKKQLASLQRIQKVTFQQLSELREEKDYFVTQERKRAQRAQRKTKQTSGPTNGAAPHADADVEMSEFASDKAASSDSEELEGSDHTEASSGEASDANLSE